MLKLLAKYGSLTHKQLVHLIECENTTFRFGPNSQLPYQLQIEANKLISNLGYLKYEPLTGRLSVEEDTLQFLGLSNQKAQIISIENISNVTSREIKYTKIGCGSEIVYVIYSTAMRIEAVLKNRDIWPLKVGKTNNLERRLKQLSESGPNSLCVGLAIYTDNSYNLEQHIHQVLTERGQFLRITGRKEWFRSNLEEIKAIFNKYKSKGLI